MIARGFAIGAILATAAIAACGRVEDPSPRRLDPAVAVDAAPPAHADCATAARNALRIVFPDDFPAQMRWYPDAIRECARRAIPGWARDCAAAARDRAALDDCRTRYSETQ